jgi:hypothetical protein
MFEGLARNSYHKRFESEALKQSIGFYPALRVGFLSTENWREVQGLGCGPAFFLPEPLRLSAPRGCSA